MYLLMNVSTNNGYILPLLKWNNSNKKSFINLLLIRYYGYSLFVSSLRSPLYNLWKFSIKQWEEREKKPQQQWQLPGLSGVLHSVCLEMHVMKPLGNKTILLMGMDCKTHTQSVSYTRTHRHTRTHAHTHTRTHARTHAHTHAHTHTHTHTHTHAHTHTLCVY